MGIQITTPIHNMVSKLFCFFEVIYKPFPMKRAKYLKISPQKLPKLEIQIHIALNLLGDNSFWTTYIGTYM